MTRGTKDISQLHLGHLRTIPVSDLARSHQCDAVVTDDIIEQRLQILIRCGMPVM
jgi:hypothetical protein